MGWSAGPVFDRRMASCRAQIRSPAAERARIRASSRASEPRTPTLRAPVAAFDSSRTRGRSAKGATPPRRADRAQDLWWCCPKRPAAHLAMAARWAARRGLTSCCREPRPRTGSALTHLNPPYLIVTVVRPRQQERWYVATVVSRFETAKSKEELPRQTPRHGTARCTASRGVGRDRVCSVAVGAVGQRVRMPTRLASPSRASAHHRTATRPTAHTVKLHTHNHAKRHIGKRQVFVSTFISLPLSSLSHRGSRGPP